MDYVPFGIEIHRQTFFDTKKLSMGGTSGLNFSVGLIL